MRSTLQIQTHATRRGNTVRIQLGQEIAPDAATLTVSDQDDFPFPFSSLGADLNWIAATYGEIVFAVMLLLGLFTRFAAISLVVITVVATAAVHWPADWGSLAELWQGYAISNKGAGNFKLPLLFVVVLLPLVFHWRAQGREDYLERTVVPTLREAEVFYHVGPADRFAERFEDWVANRFPDRFVAKALDLAPGIQGIAFRRR